MYAAGRIPGSFFRREGRPSEDAILTCRLIDRPLRPSFAKGLRNEVQVVETILALDPSHPYDVVAINAASMSTKLSGLPFTGPVGATRVAHIDGQWVAFPTHDELTRATFDMVVAGRTLPDGDVAIMMVEAEATEHTVALVAGGARADRGDRGQRSGGGQAGHPRALPGAERAGREDREADRRIPGVPGVPGRRVRRRRRGRPRRHRRGAEDRQQGRPRGSPGPVKEQAIAQLGGQFEGREKEISGAIRSVTKKEVRARVLREQVRIDGRGPRDIRPLTAEVACSRACTAARSSSGARPRSSASPR